MAKVYCLRIPGNTKTLTLRNVRPVKTETKPGACDDAIFLDLAGNCFTGKPQTGIIIGGYVIHNLDSELPGDFQIRY